VEHSHSVRNVCLTPSLGAQASRLPRRGRQAALGRSGVRHYKRMNATRMSPWETYKLQARASSLYPLAFGRRVPPLASTLINLEAISLPQRAQRLPSEDRLGNLRRGVQSR